MCVCVLKYKKIRNYLEHSSFGYLLSFYTLYIYIYLSIYLSIYIYIYIYIYLISISNIIC